MTLIYENLISHKSTHFDLGFSGSSFEFESPYFIKKSSRISHDILKSEAQWYAGIDDRVACAFPNFHCIEEIGDEVMLKLELLDGYAPLSRYLGSEIEKTRIYTSAINFVFDEMHLIKSHHKANGVKLIFEQTVKRLKSTLPKTILTEELIIDNEKYPSLNKILLMADACITNDKYHSGDNVLCHGDLHAGNIMTTGDDFKLIDPRGEFPGGGKYFSAVYDGGKLLHDIWLSYTNILSGSVFVTENSCNTYSLHSKKDDKYFHFDSILKNFISTHVKSDNQEKLYKMAASLLMLGILPFHKGKPWFNTLLIVGIKSLFHTISRNITTFKV